MRVHELTYSAQVCSYLQVSFAFILMYKKHLTGNDYKFFNRTLVFKNKCKL